MCGILGSFGNNISFNEKDLISIEHRGPDGFGFLRKNNISIGHTRLSILDLSQNGKQPMFSNDNNYCIVFNGEIYNHISIREELLNFGYSFKSTTDTETILCAYIHWGDHFLKKLNGIFSLAIIDFKKNNLFFARDHLGVKPFYYYLDDKNFCFSSELKTFVQHDYIKKDLDYNALFFYLQNLYTPNELTPFVSIKKLLPGFCGNYNFKSNKCIFKKYYQIAINENLKKYSENELIDQLDELLINSVKRQLLSDVPIGFFLSGGLDSSLLVAIAAKFNGAQNIECFTISSGKNMHSEGFSDDEYYANLVANHLNVKLNIINDDTDILNDIDSIVWYLDEPQADPATFHVKNISKIAKQKGYKVLIGGTGGDDIFSGYRRHKALIFEPYLKFIPKFVFIFFGFIFFATKINRPFIRRIKKLLFSFNLSKYERLSSYFSWIDELHILNLFTDFSRKQILLNETPMHYFKSKFLEISSKYSDLNKMLLIEQTTFLPHHNLNYTDKMGMSEGVEIRVPFLDIELFEFANSLPTNLKMKNFEVKYILKKVAERYLPNEVIYREKTGFGSPLRSLIKNNSENLFNNYLSDLKLKDNNIFNYRQVQELIKKSNSGKIDASYSILGIIAIESWVKQFKISK